MASIELVNQFLLSFHNTKRKGENVLTSIKKIGQVVHSVNT